jgi:hypothetical protein
MVMGDATAAARPDEEPRSARSILHSIENIDETHNSP